MVEALITGGIAIVVCLINNYFQAKAIDKKHNETITLIDYKLSELTKRVDKHNNVVERTYGLEKAEAVHEEEIKVINHRLKDLETEVKNHEN